MCRIGVGYYDIVPASTPLYLYKLCITMILLNIKTSPCYSRVSLLDIYASLSTYLPTCSLILLLLWKRDVTLKLYHHCPLRNCKRNSQESKCTNAGANKAKRCVDFRGPARHGRIYAQKPKAKKENIGSVPATTPLSSPSRESATTTPTSRYLRETKQSPANGNASLTQRNPQSKPQRDAGDPTTVLITTRQHETAYSHEEKPELLS